MFDLYVQILPRCDVLSQQSHVLLIFTGASVMEVLDTDGDNVRFYFVVYTHTQGLIQWVDNVSP